MSNKCGNNKLLFILVRHACKEQMKVMVKHTNKMYNKVLYNNKNDYKQYENTGIKYQFNMAVATYLFMMIDFFLSNIRCAFYEYGHLNLILMQIFLDTMDK